MGGDEEGSEVSESLKISQAVFVKLIGKGIQVCNTIFDDPDPLGIEPLRTIEKIHDASADHRIQCHQGPLVLASYLRPSLILVGSPERQHGIPIHIADLQRSRLTQFRSIHPSAWNNRTARVRRLGRQSQSSTSSHPTHQSMISPRYACDLINKNASLRSCHAPSFS